MPAVSVVIPTHNPQLPTLARVLTALRAQSLPPSDWEVLLIDNGSATPLDSSSLPGWFPGITIIPEARLGLTYARLAGVGAARGDIIVFVDDDNVLASDFLATVVAFLRDHPAVGACGGRIVGEFAAAPPSWAAPHLQLLALRDHGEQPLISQHKQGAVKEYDWFAPLGAGLVVRAEVARGYARWVSTTSTHLTDRQGSSLASGGDCEIVMCALNAGWQLGYCPALRLTHIIPASRLNFSYLARLSYAGAVCWAQFLRRYQLQGAIPAWTVPIRQAKSFITSKAWTRSGFITWRGRCGYFLGSAS